MLLFHTLSLPMNTSARTCLHTSGHVYTSSSSTSSGVRLLASYISYHVPATSRVTLLCTLFVSFPVVLVPTTTSYLRHEERTNLQASRRVHALNLISLVAPSWPCPVSRPRGQSLLCAQTRFRCAGFVIIGMHEESGERGWSPSGPESAAEFLGTMKKFYYS